MIDYHSSNILAKNWPRRSCKNCFRRKFALKQAASRRTNPIITINDDQIRVNFFAKFALHSLSAFSIFIVPRVPLFGLSHASDDAPPFCGIRIFERAASFDEL